MDKGKTLNPTFLDYRMPRSTDVPDIKVIDIIPMTLMVPLGPRKRVREALSALPLP